MSTAEGNWDVSSGARVMSFCLECGREVCMSCRRVGRRNARTKVIRSVSVEGELISVGIEGMYLKAGKRKAEALDGVVAVGWMEEFVTRMLLNGCESLKFSKCFAAAMSGFSHVHQDMVRPDP